ncbi:MAG: hypothetical protein QOE08_1565 [Thermoleophilaceae bacterium]|jgi:hypothetical protein|nr:hypothetical protein [Thermoleophilaceae bacterium]
MKKLLTLCALACVAALPAIASAVTPTTAEVHSAAGFCKSLRANAGTNNFVSMFGTKKNAYGKCVSKTSNATATENAQQQAQANAGAKKECKREQADSTYFHAQRDSANPSASGQTFNSYYGKNANDKNAYGKCRSKLAHDMKAAADAQDKVEATDDQQGAKTCKQEKSDSAKFQADRADNGGKDFAHYYGTQHSNYKNAFGKCVSRTSHELDQQAQAQHS